MLSMYQGSILNHLKHIERCLVERGATANMVMPGAVLTVTWRNRIFEFQPQFHSRSATGGMLMGPSLSMDVTGFAGWLPYFNKRWEEAGGKLAFKRFAVEHEIATPSYRVEPGYYENMLIKRERSSFGEGIRGPFRVVSPELPETLLGPGEYYEQFISGRIIKIIYWNARPVSVELYDMASVIGDGRSTVADLVNAKAKLTARTVPFGLIEQMVQYQGKAMHFVLQPGEQLCVDCRYGSPMFDVVQRNTNVLKELDQKLIEQIESAGKKLELSIPESLKENTVFSADGIVDASGKVWFVEMNCNPQLHPDIYPAMFESLFADADVIADQYKPLHLQKRLADARAPQLQHELNGSPLHQPSVGAGSVAEIVMAREANNV